MGLFSIKIAPPEKRLDDVFHISHLQNTSTTHTNMPTINYLPRSILLQGHQDSKIQTHPAYPNTGQPQNITILKIKVTSPPGAELFNKESITTYPNIDINEGIIIM